MTATDKLNLKNSITGFLPLQKNLIENASQLLKLECSYDFSLGFGAFQKRSSFLLFRSVSEMYIDKKHFGLQLSNYNLFCL